MCDTRGHMSKKHKVEVNPSLKKQVATLMTQLAAWQTELKDDVGHNKNNGGEDNGANGGNHIHHALTHQQDN